MECMSREKEEGRLWGEAGGGCLVEVTRYKCGDSGAVSCWWTVVV